MAVILADSKLYASPLDGSAVIAELHWDILEVSEYPGEKSRWWKVRIPGGKSGYARSQDIRSPIGYRAIFEKRGGRWLMAALVSGD